MAEKRINDDIKIDFELPRLLKNTIEEAEELDKENTIIIKQTPKEGVILNKGSKIYISF